MHFVWLNFRCKSHPFSIGALCSPGVVKIVHGVGHRLQNHPVLPEPVHSIPRLIREKSLVARLYMLGLRVAKKNIAKLKHFSSHFQPELGLETSSSAKHIEL